MITKEEVWKGLKFEMSRDEISKIFQADEYELDNYYDYDLLMDGLHKTLNKEIDFEMFKDWCVLIANSFNYTKDNYRTKLGKLYCDVGYMFDGAAFMDKYSKKEILDVISSLKYLNHLIQNVKQKKKDPFLTNGVERIMVFDHANWNWDTSVYRVIIKDYNRKLWEIKYVDDGQFDFVEEINYSFVSDKQFQDIFDSFYSDDNSEWKEVHDLVF